MDYCGTERGLKAHENRNEPPCFFCKKFKDSPAPPPVVVAPARVVKRAPVRRKTSPPREPRQPRAPRAPKLKLTKAPVALKPCGTVAAWSRHTHRKETPCDPCKAAKSAYDRRRWYVNRGLPVPDVIEPRTRPVPDCGTYAAMQRHKRAGETVDEPCAEAGRVYAKMIRKIRKLAKQEVARHVLGFYGIEGFPEPPAFEKGLLDLMDLANEQQAAALAQGFPLYSNTRNIALHSQGGIGRMTKLANEVIP